MALGKNRTACDSDTLFPLGPGFGALGLQRDRCSLDEKFDGKIGFQRSLLPGLSIVQAR
jgi:hypothetical protein